MVSGGKNVAVFNLHIPLQPVSPGRAVSDFFLGCFLGVKGAVALSCAEGGTECWLCSNGAPWRAEAGLRVLILPHVPAGFFIFVKLMRVAGVYFFHMTVEGNKV